MWTGAEEGSTACSSYIENVGNLLQWPSWGGHGLRSWTKIQGHWDNQKFNNSCAIQNR